MGGTGAKCRVTFFGLDEVEVDSETDPGPLDSPSVSLLETILLRGSEALRLSLEAFADEGTTV